MANKIAGICYIKADGVQFSIEGGVETPAFPLKRETVEALSGPVGYKETVVTPYIKLTAIVTADFPRAQLANNTSMTVTVEFPTGWVYVLSNAWVVGGDSGFKVDEGKIDLEFNGLKHVWRQ